MSGKARVDAETALRVATSLCEVFEAVGLRYREPWERD